MTAKKVIRVTFRQGYLQTANGGTLYSTYFNDEAFLPYEALFEQANLRKRIVAILSTDKLNQLKKDERRLETTEMKMLRRMLGVTLKNRIRNEDVRRRTSDIECGVGDRG